MSIEEIVAAQGGKILKKVKISDEPIGEIFGYSSSSIIEYTVQKADGSIECFNVAVWNSMEDEKS